MSTISRFFFLMSLCLLVGCFAEKETLSKKQKIEHAVAKPSIRIALSAAFVSQNGVDVYEKIVDYISKETGVKTELVTGLAYETINELLKKGEIDSAFICGYPYVLLGMDKEKVVDLIAAPVMMHPRYKGRPVYFSDLIVRKGTSFKSLASLKGKVFVYNDEISNSGFNMPRFHFVEKGIGNDFFAQVKRSGSHEESIRMVANGKADFSYVDSLVLEYDLATKQGDADKVKVIESLGPAGIPPIVVSNTVGAEVKKLLKQTLLSMHHNEKGAAILEEALVSHFEDVSDLNYNEIRKWDRVGRKRILASDSGKQKHQDGKK